MNRLIPIILISFLSCISLYGQNIEFNGLQRPAITEDAPTASGLNKVYVLYNLNGASISYTPAGGQASAVIWQKFDMRGAAYSTSVNPADVSVNGGKSTLTNIEGATGYAIIDGTRTTYIWIVDYSATPFTAKSLGINLEDSDCDRTSLYIDGSADRIVYYGITGRSFDLDRAIQVSYTTMTFDDSNFRYTTTQTTQTLPYLSAHNYVASPLCDTYFHLSGDKFLKSWGLETELVSPHFTTTAIGCTASATQFKENADNEVKIEDTMGALGGSAPVDIEFRAAITDAVVFTQWQVARDEQFDDITYRTSDLDFRHTFTDQGMFYVRFVAANSSGSCEYTSETYTIMIGESRLQCPNAFSPGATEGVNDEWKVSYRSIIEFECYIFNRWGKKLAEFHDPTQGWDGKYGGKLVPPGVYYYVIKARGADGKEYKLSGDINILRYTK